MNLKGLKEIKINGNKKMKYSKEFERI